MIVCICRRVSDRDIHRLIAEGASSFEEVQIETGAATCCGCCESCAREVYETAQHQHGRVHAHWIALCAEPATAALGGGHRAEGDAHLERVAA